MPVVIHQPVKVATGSPDEDGRLVFAGGELVAVLVELSQELHRDLGGCWFVEAGFGPCAEIEAQVFRDLDAVTRTIRQRLVTPA